MNKSQPMPQDNDKIVNSDHICPFCGRKTNDGFMWTNKGGYYCHGYCFEKALHNDELYTLDL